jgi:hypothetical protein
VPDHLTFSKNRHGRFRESDLLRKLLETVVARCMKEGIVGGEAFAVDASMDVEATTAVRQAEVGAAKTMLDRTAARLDVTPSRLVANAGYGSAQMVGWLIDERGIEQHVKLMDKSERSDGTFSRSDFAFNPEGNFYVCPGGRELKKYPRAFSKPRAGPTKDDTFLYFARKRDCDAFALKPKCYPASAQDRALRS